MAKTMALCVCWESIIERVCEKVGDNQTPVLSSVMVGEGRGGGGDLKGMSALPKNSFTTPLPTGLQPAGLHSVKELVLQLLQSYTAVSPAIALSILEPL